jgi:hypothetical protein
VGGVPLSICVKNQPTTKNQKKNFKRRSKKSGDQISGKSQINHGKKV